MTSSIRHLTLWIPDWSFSSLVIDTPPGSAAAIVRNHRILQASAYARHRGVRRSMSLSVARSLCPELLFLPEDPERANTAFSLVLNVFDEFSAGVVCLRPGLAWVPAQTPTRWYGSEEKAVGELVERVTEHLGIECYAGIGSGVVAAIHAGRTGSIIPEKETPHVLASLTLTYVCSLLPDTISQDVRPVVEQLDALGIVTVEDFLSHDPLPFFTRWGSHAHNLWELVSRRDLYMPATERHTHEICVESDIEAGAIAVEHMIAPVAHITEKLAGKLKTSGVHSHTLTVSIELTNGDIKKRSWNGVNARLPSDVMERVRWQLRGWLDFSHTLSESTEPIGISQIKLCATDLTHIPENQ